MLALKTCCGAHADDQAVHQQWHLQQQHWCHLLLQSSGLPLHRCTQALLTAYRALLAALAHGL